MRLRKKKWAKPLLESSKDLVISSYDNLNWEKIFNNTNPIYLEIGMGKGEFITTLASLNPNINYVGIEISETIAAIATKKVIEKDLSNVRIINADASLLKDIFSKKQVSRIYLNFSDPWPKKRHEKKRLTAKEFLDIYQTILIANGTIYLKTDNKNLFDFSLNSLEENGWTLSNINYNYPLTRTNDDVPTEYELKFRQLNNPIYQLEAKRGV